MGRHVIACGIIALAVTAAGSELQVGMATADITPKLPVALMGQFNLRIARSADTPLTANVLALESRESGKPVDSAVMVSCDLVGIPNELLAKVRESAHKRASDLDVNKIFLNGTHTHTAPVLEHNMYPIPKEGCLQVDECVATMADQIGEAIGRAWSGRSPGSVTWGLGHAVVAHNRRAVFADGKAAMYGKTDSPNFRGLEAGEEHDVGSLFFWNAAGKLIGVVVNVSCTAQEVEGLSKVNADFCHPLRERLQKRFGEDLCVLTWIGAAGDQSPHLMYRKAADDRMTKLRGLSRVDEIARRLDRAVEEAYDAVKDDRHADACLIHKVETVRLPRRLVTEAEYAEAKKAADLATEQIAKDPKSADTLALRAKWNQKVVDRFEAERTEPSAQFEFEMHVLRLGDAAICTNPFELFTEYGIRIKAQSKAVQTFVIQLTGSGAGYLPTDRAVQGGGYSAVVQSGKVGPAGGQLLVEETVKQINALWPESKN